MKILICSQFYTPEMLACALRVSENAKAWTEKGHELTVFTGYPNYPKGELFDGYTIKTYEEENLNGIRVIRNRMSIYKDRSFVKRILNMGSFLFYGAFNMLFRAKKIGQDYDVVIATSGPVFTGVLGWFFSRLHKIPFVFEIRDITYKQLLATGASENGKQYKLMRWLELWLCRHAAHVVCVTDGFKETLIGDGIPAERISVITNGVDIAAPSVCQVPVNTVGLSYYGTFGISQKVAETFAYSDVIRDCVDHMDYTIIGGGAERSAIEQEAAARNYVSMLQEMASDVLEPYYNRTNLAIVKLVKSEAFKPTLPSKLFQIMGRGIAVLFIGPDGEAAQIIRENNTGILLTGTLEEDSKVLRSFFSSGNWQEQLTEMGQNGAKLVRQKYSRRKLAENYLELLENVVKD